MAMAATMTVAVSGARFNAVSARAESSLSRNGAALSMAAAPAATSSMTCAFSRFSALSKSTRSVVARASELERELEKQLFGSVTDEVMGSASSAVVINNDALLGGQEVVGSGSSAGPSVGSSGEPSVGSSVEPSVGSSVEPSAGSSVEPSAGSSAGPSAGSSAEAAVAATEEQQGPKLYVGNLPWTCDSAQLAEICGDHGTVDIVEVIYDMESGRSRGFAFVTMASNEDAQAVIDALDGTDMGGRALRVNYPQANKDKSRFERSEGRPGFGDRRAPRDEPNKLFVGNLSWGCDEGALEQLFSDYGKVVDAKIVYDRESGRSRGFGFVTLENVSDANTAIESLDGAEYDGRKLRVNAAGDKPVPSFEGSSPRSERSERPFGGDRGPRDEPNKLFVGNLSWNCDEGSLEQLFSDYGRVVDAKIAYDRESGRSRGFGFVTLADASEVNKAIEKLDGADFEGRQLRVNLAGDKPPIRF